MQSEKEEPTLAQLRAALQAEEERKERLSILEKIEMLKKANDAQEMAQSRRSNGGVSSLQDRQDPMTRFACYENQENKERARLADLREHELHDANAKEARRILIQTSVSNAEDRERRVAMHKFYCSREKIIPTVANFWESIEDDGENTERFKLFSSLRKDNTITTFDNLVAKLKADTQKLSAERTELRKHGKI
jgi:hypothetical protein